MSLTGNGSSEVLLWGVIEYPEKIHLCDLVTTVVPMAGIEPGRQRREASFLTSVPAGQLRQIDQQKPS